MRRALAVAAVMLAALACAQIFSVDGPIFNNPAATSSDVPVDLTLNGQSLPLAQQCLTDAGIFTESPVVDIGFSRASPAYCTKSNGTLVLVGVNQPRRERQGYLAEPARSNLADVRSDGGTGAARDLTDPAWTVSNMICTLNATGADGAANKGNHCVAQANNGLVKMALTVSSSARATSFHVRRASGSGSILVSRDNFVTTTDISAGLSSSIYTWVLNNCGGRGSDVLFSTIDNCTAASNLRSTSANPTIGVKIANAGEAVDIDFAQDEPWYTTSPITGFDRVADQSAPSGAGLPTTQGELSVDWVSERGGATTQDHAGAFPSLVLSGFGGGANGVWDWFSSDTGAVGAYIQNGSGLSQLGPVATTFVAGRSRNQRVTWGTNGNAYNFFNGVGESKISDGSANTPTGAHSGPYYIGGYLTLDDYPLGGWISRVRWTSGAVTTFPGSALTVNIYGDSITEASNNLVTEGFYPEQVMQSHIGGRIGDRYVNNNGTSGNTIQQCDSNARGDIVEALAYPGTKAKRVIVFQCGTNSEGDGAAAVWAIINTLVLDSIDAGVRILPATITPYVARDPFIQGVNTRMKNVFTDAGIPWCDTYHDMEFPADSGILNPAYDFGDNIHVRAAGAQAEAVAWYNCGRDAGYWPRRALPLRGAHWDVRHTRRVERRKASGE